MSPAAPDFIDLATWPRRQAFEFFRGFDKPYFNVCVQVDVTRLQSATLAAGARFAHACYYIAMRAANEVEPFRYRLVEGRVQVLPEVHLGGTVLRDDDGLAFVRFDYAGDFPTFAARAAEAIDATRRGDTRFVPAMDDAAQIHITILPWVHFTSFSHARNWGREDSVPKLAFGKVVAQGERRLMPMSVEVHHAMMDGLHVGRFIERVEALAAMPQDWMG